MISSEKVFDMLPIVVDLYDKLDLDGYRKRIVEENKGKKDLNKEMLGIDMFKHILKNSKKVKEEVFEIVAIFGDITIEEAKAQSFSKTIGAIKEIVTDKETTDFLKQAMQ